MAVYKQEDELSGSLNTHGANGFVDVRLMSPMKADKARPQMQAKMQTNNVWLGYAMEGSEVEVNWSDYDEAKDPFTVLFNWFVRSNKMTIKLETKKYDLIHKDGHVFSKVVIENMKNKADRFLIRFENTQSAK